MNNIPDKNMETILKEIKELRGLDGLSNGRVLVSLFSDLSQDKKDLRLIRYLVESGCHTDLLGARELSAAMRQARLQQTVTKLCAETLVSEDAARQVCTAFWNAVYGPVVVYKQEERKIQASPQKPEPQVLPDLPPDKINLMPPKRENAENNEKTSKSKWVITLIAVAALLAVILLPGLLKKDAATPAAQMQENASQAAPEEISLSEYIQRTQSENGSRVLMEDPMQYNLDENGYLKTFPVFGTDLMRDQVASVTFLDTLKDAPSEVVDLSAARDGSVQSWIVPNGDLFDLYIAAEGGVKAPENSSGLFAQYAYATSISFNNCFDTSGAIYLDQMFYGCSSLKNVDLKGIDTGNAEIMSFLFSGCASLTSVDVSHFHTGNVRDFSFMFSDCTALTALDVSSFDTSKAEDMAGMFSSCWFVEKLDLSGFHTGNVTDMSFMFSNCINLAELNVSSFDTSSVTDMRYMFYSAEKLQNLDLSGFDVSKVTEYDSFMKSGAKINGYPWEKMFAN